MDNISFCQGRYETTPSTIDIGRSGLPGLARDTITGNVVFTKKADIFSLQYQQQRHDLLNEAKSLQVLAGARVPMLLNICVDKDVANKSDSKESLCLIIEHTGDAKCVLENYEDLSLFTRIDIITQLFECLSFAHENRIVNGDVDLKHLFWKSEVAQLLVIDWANSLHEINDPVKYALDIARAAEVTYTLLTLQPFPSDSKTPLTSNYPLDTPDEFRDLCNWAPRLGIPVEKTHWATSDLLKVAKQWKTNITNSLIIQADESYYAGDVEQTIEIYGEILKRDSENVQAKEKLEKAKTLKYAHEKDKELPREAKMLYRQARSYIAAGDLAKASELLKKAIEVAANHGVEYKTAQEALESIELLTIVYEYEQKAFVAIEAQEWAKAAANLEKAIQVDPNTRTAKVLLDQLENLLLAQSLIEQLHAGISDRNRISLIENQIREIISKTNKLPELIKLWQNVVVRFGEYNSNQNNRTTTVRYSLWASITSLAIVLLILWYLFLFPRNQILVDCDQSVSGLFATLNYPVYIANGDDGKIQITLSNTGNLPVDGTVLVDFQGTAAVQIIDPTNSNSIPFDLNPNERKSTTIRFFINEPMKIISDPSLYVNLNIIAKDNSNPCRPQNIHIATSPIFGLNSLVTFLWGSIGLAIIGLFWERIKEILRLKG